MRGRIRFVIESARRTLPLVVLLTVTAVACSSHQDGDPEANAPVGDPNSTTTAASKKSPGHPTGSSRAAADPIDLPDHVTNQPAARAAVRSESCATTKGKGATSTGAFTAMARESATYRITVYFTDTHSAVVGWGRTVVKVNGGEPKRWKVRGNFDAPGKVTCVLRGVAVDRS